MDWRRIEVMDETMVQVLRRKTPAERIAIGFGLWRSARKLLRGQLASLHPDWGATRLEREVARMRRILSTGLNGWAAADLGHDKRRMEAGS
jgi:hypothetical protein